MMAERQHGKRGRVNFRSALTLGLPEAAEEARRREEATLLAILAPSTVEPAEPIEGEDERRRSGEAGG